MKTRGGPDAFYTDEPVPLLCRGDIEAIKAAILRSTYGRTRLCAHHGPDDALQEMFIVLGRSTYVRPHKHTGKVESLLVLEGLADAVFFDDAGTVLRSARLGDYASGREFYYRIGDGVYHTLVIRTDTLVFKEVTLGPFEKSKTVYAPWSPAADDVAAVYAYTTDLAARVAILGS